MPQDMYLKIDGVPGEATASGHEGQIEVSGFSWGLHQEGDLHRGTGGGMGKAAIHDLSITKSLDKSTSQLIKAGIGLQSYKTATLICRESGGDKKINYLEIEMSDVLITNYNVGSNPAAPHAKPSENFTLQFAKFKLKYTGQKNDGSADKVAEVSYDIKLQKFT